MADCPAVTDYPVIACIRSGVARTWRRAGPASSTYVRAGVDSCRSSPICRSPLAQRRASPSRAASDERCITGSTVLAGSSAAPRRAEGSAGRAECRRTQHLSSAAQSVGAAACRCCRCCVAHSNSALRRRLSVPLPAGAAACRCRCCRLQVLSAADSAADAAARGCRLQLPIGRRLQMLPPQMAAAEPLWACRYRSCQHAAAADAAARRRGRLRRCGHLTQPASMLPPRASESRERLSPGDAACRRPAGAAACGRCCLLPANGAGTCRL
jgi:hypothetical protein